MKESDILFGQKVSGWTGSR